MSNPGEWIDFAELCRRVKPKKSASTLRRYTADKVISSRQLVKGGRRDYNWKTVERELATLETEGVHAHVAAMAALPADYPPDLVAQVAEMRALLGALAEKLGVTPPALPVFAGKQRRAG